MNTEVRGRKGCARGNVTGDLQAEFGAVGRDPVTFDVDFNREGPWRVEVEGWSSAIAPDGTPRNIRTSAVLELVVTPKGEPGPALDGPPRLVATSPVEGDQDVEPSAIVKLTFSEPVLGCVPSAFVLRQADGSTWPKNAAHHNFYDAYACSVGTEDTLPVQSLPASTQLIRRMMSKALNPLEGVGRIDCLQD